jgi:hypothetical protein
VFFLSSTSEMISEGFLLEKLCPFFFAEVSRFFFCATGGSNSHFTGWT